MAASRIETTARHLGYAVRAARTVDQFWAGIADHPDLVLLATQQARLPWENLLRELAQRPDAPPVLAFGSHIDAATRARAKAAGATRWVANSRIAQDLPGLIQQMLGTKPSDQER